MNDEVFQAPVAAAPRAMTAAAESDVQRAIAEVQGAIILAKKFPRNIDASIESIKRECGRVALAEVAAYEYAKGGTKIEGPSIRLAEALSLAWGNVHSGWRELSRSVMNGVNFAEIEAWAWDMESNKREAVNFKVKLMRDTKKGSYALKDEREVYEHCANQAKRRERACMLAVIPGYIQDMAVDLCRETLAKTVNIETTKIMVKTFEDRFGVKQAQLEKFIQCDLAAITPAQVVRLRQIANSLKDGMSKPEDWFESDAPPEPEKPEAKGNDALKNKLAEKTDAISVTSNGQTGGVTAAVINPSPAVSFGETSSPSSTEPTVELGKTQQLNQAMASSLLVKLMEELETAPPITRPAIFVQGNGSELVEVAGRTPQVEEALKKLGINLPTQA